MKTALPLFLFLLLGCLRLNAGNPAPDFYAYCLECGTPQNLAVQNLTATSATLVWDAVAGATKYNLEVENTQNSSGSFHVDTTVTGISFQLGGLQPGKTYKFKVRARCGGDHGDWAEWHFFTTGPGTASPGDTTSNSNCAAPTSLNSVVTGTSALLSWNHVGNAGHYYLEVEDEQNQPSNFQLEVQVSDTFYQLNGIQPNVLYKFKVSTHCDSSSSHGPWSAWHFFNSSDSTSNPVDTSANCAAPTMLASAVTGTSALLSWNHVGNAGQYYLEVEDEQNQPSNFHLEIQVSDTFYQLNGIQPNVLYKFKVSTHCDSSSHGPWSNWQFFNGNSDSTGTGGNSGSSSCGKPVGLHVTGISSSTANLHWFAVPGALSYTLEIERFQNSTSAPWQITQVVSTNSFHLSGLNANTRYKFKVRANCASGHSDWSNWRKFQTVHGVLAPAVFNHGSALEDRDGNPSVSIPAFDLQIWPNPVKTTATVRLGNLKEGTVSLLVMDLSGRTVMERQFHQENNELEETISFRELPEGCYLLRVQNGADVKSAKLVVIR